MWFLQEFIRILFIHYRNPRNNRVIEGADFCSEQRNSSCGDEVLFTGTIRDNTLAQACFTGKGCVISQAAASLLSEHAQDKSLDTILSLDKDDVIAMIGMPLGPVRLLCGLLPLTALQNGIRSHARSSQVTGGTQ